MRFTFGQQLGACRPRIVTGSAAGALSKSKQLPAPTTAHEQSFPLTSVGLCCNVLPCPRLLCAVLGCVQDASHRVKLTTMQAGYLGTAVQEVRNSQAPC